MSPITYSAASCSRAASRQRGASPGWMWAQISSTTTRVLGDGKGVLAHRLPVPARHPGQAVGDVLDLDVERGGVQQVEPAAGKHALPGARRTLGGSLRCTTFALQPFAHSFVP